jgi:NADP-dependent 3-hydroxy acid dehydrogenase YdfG
MAEAKKPVAVVVGVGAGLGAALARRFASAYTVALVAQGGGKLEELAGEIKTAEGRAAAVPADVSKAGEIEAAFARIHEEIGETDVLLYNAAIAPMDG